MKFKAVLIIIITFSLGLNIYFLFQQFEVADNKISLNSSFQEQIEDLHEINKVLEKRVLQLSAGNSSCPELAIPANTYTCEKE